MGKGATDSSSSLLWAFETEDIEAVGVGEGKICLHVPCRLHVILLQDVFPLLRCDCLHGLGVRRDLIPVVLCGEALEVGLNRSICCNNGRCLLKLDQPGQMGSFSMEKNRTHRGHN